MSVNNGLVKYTSGRPLQVAENRIVPYNHGIVSSVKSLTFALPPAQREFRNQRRALESYLRDNEFECLHPIKEEDSFIETAITFNSKMLTLISLFKTEVNLLSMNPRELQMYANLNRIPELVRLAPFFKELQLYETYFTENIPILNRIQLHASPCAYDRLEKQIGKEFRYVYKLAIGVMLSIEKLDFFKFQLTNIEDVFINKH